MEKLFPLNYEPINARILELIRSAEVKMGFDEGINPDGTPKFHAYSIDPEFEGYYPFVSRWHPGT